MPKSRKELMVPLLIVGVGVGWLLNASAVLPGVDWAWSLGLGTLGIAMLVCAFDKVTAVAGPFLMIASGLSVARQSTRLDLEMEAPILVIVFGLLLFAVQLLPIPTPRWVLDDASRRECELAE